MINKIKMLTVSAMTMFSLALPTVLPATVSAAVTSNNIKGGLCSGANGVIPPAGSSPANPDATCATNGQGDDLNTKIAHIINWLSALIGVVAVVMIIFGGFKYITSGGNESSVGSAKKTILYALIGLVIVALSQLIVKFVLQNVQ